MRWFIVAGLMIACGGRTDIGGGGLQVEGLAGSGESPSDGTMAAIGDQQGNQQGDPSVDPEAGTDFPICPPAAPAVGSPCVMPPEQGCKYYVRSRLGGTWSCQAFVCGKARL